MKVKNEKPKLIKKMVEYFNEPVGLLYRLKSDLETTLLVINKFPIDDVKKNLDHIKESLSSFSIKNYLINVKPKNKKQIEMYIKKQIVVVNEELNRNVQTFMVQNKI